MTFRIVGVVVGLIVIAAGLMARRRQRLSRGETIAWSLVGLTIAALSVYPQIGGIFAPLFGLENRLFGVLVAAVIVLVGLQLRSRSRLQQVETKFGQLVRNLAIQEFHEEHERPDHRPTLAVVMAAYNEEEAIGGVLSDLPFEVEGLRVEPIVVVDGGDDDTEGVVRRGGYLVATHPVNRGQGDALRTGFSIALQRGADVVVTMDVDGQHRPDQLGDLVKPIIADEADYVQGSRFLGQYDDAGGVRHAGIQMFTRLINLLSDAGITDCTNGYRAIRATRLARMRLEEDRFSAPEIIMEAATNGLRMQEIPIHIRSRSHGESKKPRRLGYPIGFLRTIITVWLR